MRTETERAYHERILRVLVHIQRHLDEALSLDELARVAHFSPFHFHRIFRGLVGESVREHVRRLRLERAAHRLKFGDQPVTRLAFEAGFETLEAFSRAFRARFGEAPSRFREVHRALPFPAVASGVHFDPDAKVTDFQPLAVPLPEVRVETVAPLRVAFVRHVGPYASVGLAWERLFRWAGMRGHLAPAVRTFGVVHDDPEVTPPERVRYDACITIGIDCQPDGEVGIQDIGGGDFAVAAHRGPYDQLGESYARVCGVWLPASGRELRATPPFEAYINSPRDTARADLLTLLHLPLEP